MKGKSFLTVKDVQRECGVGASKAYEIMREMNRQLAEQGYLTIAGKVPKAYFYERIYGRSEED